MNWKLLWLSLLLPVLWAEPAGAEPASGTTLGQAAVFTTSPVDMMAFPSEVGSFGRLIAIDLDSFPFSHDRMSLAAVWSDDQGKFGSVGLAFGDLNSQSEFNGLIVSLNDAIASHPMMSPRNAIPFPDSRFHLMYAREVGPVTAGLSLGLASGARDYDFSDTIPQDAVRRRAQSGIWSMAAGASAVFSDNIYLQAAASIQGLSFSSSFELSGADPIYWEKVESSQGRGGQLDVRMFYGLNGQIKLVPALAVHSLKSGYLASYADTMHLPGSVYNRAGGEYEQGAVKLCLGTEYCPDRRIKLLAGMSLGSERVEIKDSNNVWLGPLTPAGRLSSRTVSTITLPELMAGVEAELLDWFVIRLGASQKADWVRDQKWYTDQAASKVSFSRTEYTASFGLGLRFGSLSVDAQLAPGQPFELGYLMSGNTTAAIAMLSAEYRY